MRLRQHNYKPFMISDTPSPLRYILAYLFWAITFVLTIFVLLQWRNALLMVLGMSSLHRYTEQSINQFAIIIFALVSLCFIVYTEHLYRTGVEKMRLFARFFRVSFIQLVCLLFSHLVILIGTIVLGLPVGIAWLVTLVDVVGSVLLYWLYKKSL